MLNPEFAKSNDYNRGFKDASAKYNADCVTRPPSWDYDKLAIAYKEWADNDANYILIEFGLQLVPYILPKTIMELTRKFPVMLDAHNYAKAKLAARREKLFHAGVLKELAFKLYQPMLDDTLQHHIDSILDKRLERDILKIRAQQEELREQNIVVNVLNYDKPKTIEVQAAKNGEPLILARDYTSNVQEASEIVEMKRGTD